MAYLFSHKLLDDAVKGMIVPDAEKKIAILQQRVTALQNGTLKQKTESECEQAFNLDIFKEILGYSFYPNDNFTLEAKGGNEISGQKADATLGHFRGDNLEKNTEAVQVAVEIKDANTALDKSQRREGNLSPVQQGFKYKPQYINCKRVLVTNFVEIRLYKDTMLDYEVWQLADLIKPENDYHQFKVFRYLLQAKHLISPTGTESFTEKLLSKVRLHTDKITKDFYKDYKTLRLELINDIRSHNPDHPIETIIQKAQKVIDRIVFVHFCEDFGLLPEGKLTEVVRYAENHPSGEPIRKTLTGFFEAVNSGSPKLSIPNGYNGGLFHEDAELNALKIGDSICRKFVELGNYDFQEDLSVNILGHIFEQSISDLEDLRVDLLGTQVETGELGESTKSNKRKKDGIFYTPEYIVDYIVRNSLGKWLEVKFTEIEKKHLKQAKSMKDETYDEKINEIYRAYQKVLSEVKVLDPACGSGAFLVKVFDYLMTENIRVINILAGGDAGFFEDKKDEIVKSILQNNIFGVDLNEESVEITKLSLWLKTAQKGKKLADLDNNIKCGNSLIDDPVVAGEKAFDRDKEFPQIFHPAIKVVLGHNEISSPPSKSGIKTIMKVPYMQSYIQESGFDVIVGNPPYTYRNSVSENEKNFMQKSYKSAEGNYDLYKFFIEKIVYLLNKKGLASYIVPNTFLSAKTYYKLRKIILENFHVVELFDLGLKIFENVVVESLIFTLKKEVSREQTVVKVQRNRDRPVLDLQQQHKVILTDESFNIYVSKEIRKTIDVIEENTVLLSKICYCTVGINTGYIKSSLVSKQKSNEKYHKMLNGKEIGRNFVRWSGEWIIYDKELVKSFGAKGRSLPPEHIFQSAKILVQRTRRGMKRKLICYYDTNKFYNLNRLSNIVLENDDYNLLYIYALLNSKLLDYYFNIVFNEYEVKPHHLGRLPIKKIPLSKQKSFSENSSKILILNEKFYEKIDFALRFLQSKFILEKISTKLQKFRELDFTSFKKELKIKRISMDVEADLMQYFEKEKAEILALKAQIDETDRKIDEMVFDLYGLSEEERKVVLDT